MTQTNATTHERLSTVRTYRRLYWACFAVGILGFLAGDFFGYPLAGLGVYWAGILGMVAVWKGTAVKVFDERERALERRASMTTLSLIGAVLIVGSPGRILVRELGYSLPPEFSTFMWAYVSVFAVFGVVYLAIRYRP